MALGQDRQDLYRLPTEAEWEYACEGRDDHPYSFGDEHRVELGTTPGTSRTAEKPMPVGKKKPNPWGLHDIHGNVSEWCIDLYQPDAYAEFAKMGNPAKGPVVLPTPAEYSYVARGGSWDDDADKLRSANRIASNREWSVQDPQRPQSIWWHTDATRVGFRVVRPLRTSRKISRGSARWL